MTLTDLASALRLLHRALLQAARNEYEEQHGKVRGPYALLHLASTHPDFAFLHPLSELMVDLEMLVEEKAPGESEPCAAVSDELRSLLGLTGEEGAFALRFRQLLVLDPEVVVAHTQVLKVLHALPEPDEEAERLHDQHRWALLRRHHHPDVASAATLGGVTEGARVEEPAPAEPMGSARPPAADEVEEASRESFPASDPPGWIDHGEHEP